MKRFYKVAAYVTDGDGWRIELDGRAVKTPQRAPFRVHSQRLAEAIAAEWTAQTDTIDPRSMPLTGLANAAIDHVAPDPNAFADALAAYAESDLVCYRAAEPVDLADRQAAVWDAVLTFLRQRYDAELNVTSGIVHVAQPSASLARLRAALGALDVYHLAALQPIVTISGSLAIALALLERAMDAAAAFNAGHIDELYQAEKWGDDAEAAAAREVRRRDFCAAAHFLDLL